MKTKILIILLVSFYMKNNAQTYAPLGATWCIGLECYNAKTNTPNYQIKNMNKFGSPFAQYRCIGDTMILGDTCSILLDIQADTIGDTNGVISYQNTYCYFYPKLYTKKKGNKLYRIVDGDTAFTMVFDYTVQKHDTIFNKWVVDSTYPIIVNTDTFLCFDLRLNISPFIQRTIIEDIVIIPLFSRNLLEIYYKNMCSNGVACRLLDFNSYEDSIIGRYGPNSCGYGIRHIDIDNYRINNEIFSYINTRELTFETVIEIENYMIQIHDVLGNTAAILKIKNNTATLPENLHGIYFITLLDVKKNVIYQQKILVK